MNELGLDQVSEVNLLNDRTDALSVIRGNTLRMVNQTASSTNMIEVSRVELRSDVKMGNWANAFVAVVNLGKTGYVTGLIGVICAELDMPSTNPVGSAGTYAVYEAEIGFPVGYTGGVPVTFFSLNVWGSTSAYFDTYGLLFDISGCADHATTKFFQANTAGAATHALKCRINGTLYYVMLTDTGA